MTALKQSQTTLAKRAILYCRVSSKKQTIDGGGLESQEYRCREYAQQRGYVVDAVFPDDVSGGGDFINRPGMVALLAYLDAKPNENYVVIFDDLKRYARDTEFHLKLRRIMAERGATRECLNFNFEDTPEGKFIETMLAAQGELEREQNGRQVIQKMKARLEQGFWVFHAPYGYKYTKGERGGKEIVRDEPLASVVQEALEGYASGRFQTQVEVQRFLESQPAFPKDFDNGTIRAYKVTRLLTRPVYAGYVESKKWKVALCKGRHEGLISLATFEAIQERLRGNALAPARKDISEDFILRGFVECGDCGCPLTSCWSHGKYKKFPYYRCYNKNCENVGKSIPRAKLEGQFEDIVQSLQPKPALTKLVTAMFKHAWDQRLAQAKHMGTQLKTEIDQISKQIDQLLDRIVTTDSPSVITAYERKIEVLERQRLVLADKAGRKKCYPTHSYGELFELSTEFLLNPWKLWRSGNLTLRRMVLRLAFKDRIQYSPKTGCLNSRKSLPFNMLQEVCMQEKNMVHPKRFELLTP